MSVLITGASHAEAYKVERILQLADVVFADHQDMPLMSNSGRQFIKIPKGNYPSYAHLILDLALNNGIQKIVPLYTEELLPLAESRLLFEEYGIYVLVPSVFWLKSEGKASASDRSRISIIERGKVIAGDSPKFAMPEEDFSGIFYIEDRSQDTIFTLLAV